jgi:hypothetical protein
VIDGFLLFLGIYLLFAMSPVEQRTDSVWVLHTATSIVREGDGDLDEYSDMLDRVDGWKTVDVGDHVYYDYPTGGILVAVPFTAALHVLDPQLDAILDSGVAPFHERLIASLFVAGTAVVLYLIALGQTRRRGPAVAVALIFATCTGAWSLASRALWQHGPAMFLLATVLLLLQRARNRPSLCSWAAVLCVYAYFTRPTNAPVVLLLFGYAAVQHREQLWRMALASGATIVAVLALNAVLFGEALPSYYEGGLIDSSRSTPLEGLVGNLVSPSRGILVFSPILLLAGYGVWLRWRSRRIDWLDGYVLAVLAAEWVTVSVLAPVWWSGWSFGQRFLADVIPYFVWFLIPVVDAAWPADRAERDQRSTVLATLLVLLGLLSFFIHARGATAQETFDWNRLPVDVHRDEARVWDWTDLQFLRGVP